MCVEERGDERLRVIESVRRALFAVVNTAQSRSGKSIPEEIIPRQHSPSSPVHAALLRVHSWSPFLMFQACAAFGRRTMAATVDLR